MVRFRLVFESESKKKKPRVLKLNIPPSKTQGFVNFINQSVKEDHPVTIYFEKLEGKEIERSKMSGTFKFTQTEK